MYMLNGGGGLLAGGCCSGSFPVSAIKPLLSSMLHFLAFSDTSSRLIIWLAKNF